MSFLESLPDRVPTGVRVGFPEATEEERQDLARFLEERMPEWDLTIELDRLVADVDPDEFYDFTVSRPGVTLQDGDRVIQLLADVLQGVAEAEDVVARYGGEEFTLVLPGASLRNAAKKAKQLCGTIAAARYAADDSANPDVLSISASIGVSVYTLGDTVKSIVDRADQCLYKAKKMGKNRVIIESDL